MKRPFHTKFFPQLACSNTHSEKIGRTSAWKRKKIAHLDYGKEKNL